jgi:hypothetical protein
MMPEKKRPAGLRRRAKNTLRRTHVALTLYARGAGFTVTAITNCI